MSQRTNRPVILELKCGCQVAYHSTADWAFVRTCKIKAWSVEERIKIQKDHVYTIIEQGKQAIEERRAIQGQ